MRNKKNSELSLHIVKYIDDLKFALEKLPHEKIEEAIEIILKAFKKDRKIFIMGNGGSASNASHMACDFSKGTLRRVYDENEKRIRVISLTDNVAIMTAFANDLSYEDIFIQQLRNLVEKDDVVIVLSGSGNSTNVIKAVAYAKRKEAIIIGILGFRTGGKLANLVDCAIIADSGNYGQSEDIQLILDHIITSWVGRIKHIREK